MAQNASFIENFPSGPLDLYRNQATFDWKTMKLFFEDAKLLKIKMKVWKTLEKDPIFKRSDIILTTEEMKRRTALQLFKYCQYTFLPENAAKLSYKERTRHMMTVNEALAATFPDVSVKYAIGVALFKNTLTGLGTERHQKVLDAVWNNKILSCLALTEVAHGSNTKQMRTTATYDKKTKQFVINTPDFEAAKCWVGNLGKTCTMALLFAQLYTQGQCHGLHAFIVPIRNPKTLLPYPGIIVGDIGEKIGLHGIDNGFIMFQNYRIPRENLLNRMGDVTPDGEYESSFSEPGKILGATLENLSTGRVGIMQENCNNLICAVTIAVRYAALRKQFAGKEENGEETPIIEYQLHQWRLFPYASAAAVLKIFVSSFTNDYLTAVEKSTSSTKLKDLTDVISEIHAIISSAKPLITWTSRDAVQECREACGGHGFLKCAGFGDLKGTIDPSVTYEGDNNVLIQQTSNWLLRQWLKVKQNDSVKSPLGTCAFFKRHQEILRTKFINETNTNYFNLINFNFIKQSFEWLIVYLTMKTYEKKQKLIESGRNREMARNESQVFNAAVLSRCYAEFTAISYYFNKLGHSELRNLIPVLENLGFLYSFCCLEKHLVYFYEGGYTNDSNFAAFIKQCALHLCRQLKPNILGVIDALAPPDFVLNSVLGKADGKLYENLKAAIFNQENSYNSRPNWWREIIVSNGFDDSLIRSKL